MHILILGAGWPPEIFIERKLRGLVAAGARISLAEVLQPAGPDWRGIAGVTYIPLLNPKSLRPHALSLVARRLAETIRLNASVPRRLWRSMSDHSRHVGDNYASWSHGLALAATQPDVIHFEWNRSAIRYEWVFDYFDCPTVISSRGRQVNILPHLPGYEEYSRDLKRTLKKATFVHCVSDAMRGSVLELGVEPDRAFVVRTSLDPELYGPLAPPKPPPDARSALRIVTVGGLIWRKGFEYLIRALFEVRRRGANIVLDIIGSGPDKERITHLIDECRLSNQVRFLGQLSPAAVRTHVESADIYILSSLSEGLSNSVVEAMACSIPVITTSCGGMEEAVANTVEGLVVPPRSVKGLADAICELAGDDSLRRQMGRSGRDKAMRDFMPRRQAEEFLRLYHRARGRRRADSEAGRV